jgi:hypothetical protein
MQQDDWRAAREVVERAQALFDSSGDGNLLSKRVENRRADFKMAATTEDIRLSWGGVETPMV